MQQPQRASAGNLAGCSAPCLGSAPTSRLAGASATPREEEVRGSCLPPLPCNLLCFSRVDSAEDILPVSAWFSCAFHAREKCPHLLKLGRPPFKPGGHLCPALPRPHLTTVPTSGVRATRGRDPTGPVLTASGQIQNHTTQHMIRTGCSHTELFQRSEVKTCIKNVSPSLLSGFHVGRSCGGSRDTLQRREATSWPSLRAEVAGRLENAGVTSEQPDCRVRSRGHCPRSARPCRQCPPCPVAPLSVGFGSAHGRPPAGTGGDSTVVTRRVLGQTRA